MYQNAHYCPIALLPVIDQNKDNRLTYTYAYDSPQPTFEKQVQKRETTMEEHVMADLAALSASQQVKSKLILKKIFDHGQVNIDMSGGLIVDGKPIGLSAATFLWDLQQATKNLDKTTHELVLRKLHIPDHLVINKEAKDILKHGWVSWP